MMTTALDTIWMVSRDADRREVPVIADNGLQAIEKFVAVHDPNAKIYARNGEYENEDGELEMQAPVRCSHHSWYTAYAIQRKVIS